jgi:RNA polymerase sigma-70 factor (ECF subfamily)
MPLDLDMHLPAIVTGDPVAFGRWVAGAERPLRLGLVRFAQLVDVEVVVQEALLRAWHFAPRIERDGRGNSLLRFAVRTAKNLALDELRRRRWELPALEADEPFVAPLEPDPLLRRALEECREGLPPKPAQVLEARLGAQGTDSDESLAERLGMTQNTLLKNFGRARRLLVECLERRGIRLELGGAA